jgi:hypothetical protein
MKGFFARFAAVPREPCGYKLLTCFTAVEHFPLSETLPKYGPIVSLITNSSDSVGRLRKPNLPEMRDLAESLKLANS